MIKFKYKLQNSFNLASNSYDTVAYVQKASAKLLVDSLIKGVPQFYPKTILDIGTGTGYLITYLSKYYPISNYTLNDISENMVQIAVQKFINTLQIDYIVGDLETISFSPHQLCISNFALQWSTQLFHILEKFFNISQVFAFTCLLSNTFNELKTLFKKYNLFIPKTSSYPDEIALNNFITSLKPLKYITYSKQYRIKFDTIKDFFKYLKALGARVSTFALEPNILKSIITNEGSFSTSYNVFFAIIIKNNENIY